MYQIMFGQPWNMVDSLDGPPGHSLWWTEYGMDPQCKRRACHALTPERVFDTDCPQLVTWLLCADSQFSK